MDSLSNPPVTRSPFHPGTLVTRQLSSIDTQPIAHPDECQSGLSSCKGVHGDESFIHEPTQRTSPHAPRPAFSRHTPVASPRKPVNFSRPISDIPEVLLATTPTGQKHSNRLDFMAPNAPANVNYSLPRSSHGLLRSPQHDLQHFPYNITNHSDLPAVAYPDGLAEALDAVSLQNRDDWSPQNALLNDPTKTDPCQLPYAFETSSLSHDVGVPKMHPQLHNLDSSDDFDERQRKLHHEQSLAMLERRREDVPENWREELPVHIPHLLGSTINEYPTTHKPVQVNSARSSSEERLLDADEHDEVRPSFIADEPPSKYRAQTAKLSTELSASCYSPPPQPRTRIRGAGLDQETAFKQTCRDFIIHQLGYDYDIPRIYPLHIGYDIVKERLRIHFGDERIGKAMEVFDELMISRDSTVNLSEDVIFASWRAEYKRKALHNKHHNMMLELHQARDVSSELAASAFGARLSQIPSSLVATASAVNPWLVYENLAPESIKQRQSKLKRLLRRLSIRRRSGELFDPHDLWQRTNIGT
jgi:hypothetical protein